MKKLLKPESIFCFFAIPMLWFLFSKMTTFFMDLRNIDIGGIYSFVGILVAELLIIFFRNNITTYLWKGVRFKTFLVILLLSMLSAFSMKAIFLRGCRNGGDFLCLIGASFLFSIFLLLLYKNIKYLIGRIKTIDFSKKDLTFLIGVFVVLNLEAFLYCGFMKEIFIWDNAGYFTSVHQMNDLFPGAEYFRSVYHSIFELDYNYVIMLPASLMCKLFGKSRLVFILSIANFYLYPLLVLIYISGKRYFKLSIPKVIFLVLSLPYLIFVTNAGFIDIGGTIPILLATILYYFGNRDKHSILIGILLALAIYMRRWFSFFALSFVITTLIHGITRKNLKPFLEITCSFAFVLLFFTQDFVSTKLMADYRHMYAAYALGIRTDFMLFTRYYGVLLSAVLFLYVLSKQLVHRKSFHPETFVMLQAIIMFSLFVSVQTHGQQHLALYVPVFVILFMSFMTQVNRKTGIITLAVLSSFQTINTLIPRVQPTSIQGIKRAAIIPNFSNYPTVDKNAESILPITEYMDREIGEKGKTVCFLASSLKLNYDTLNNAEISLSVKKQSGIDRSSYYCTISNVDKRDGLAETLFLTDYILVPSEVQIHLAPEEQRVISVPYQEITKGIGVGTAYVKEDVSFTLTDGTEIHLYRRTRDVTPSEIESLRNKIFDTTQ